ncbi:hypothetical protein CAEBREN_16383 [Caenorhabditis brenneri]|uniref:DNA helicase n=1 Tax=Caenorhabditis brenneri TaxID=135651 RepID=G0NGK8_CAEBE|nr:hypothetical protein CAEBREN_16383 [Caenorhabditis brenneri]
MKADIDDLFLLENAGMIGNQLEEPFLILEANSPLVVRDFLEDWTEEKVVKEVIELRESNPGKLFTILSPRWKVVNEVNKHFLSEAERREKFPSLYTKDAGNDKARECHGYAEYLELAPECQVMLTINHDVARGLVNGSVGKVEEISSDKIIVQFPQSRMDVLRVLYEKEKKMWRQFPLRMAEAMAIHAAQGKIYDGVIVMASFLETGGLVYTALSRARSLKLCRITSLKLNRVPVRSTRI